MKKIKETTFAEQIIENKSMALEMTADACRSYLTEGSLYPADVNELETAIQNGYNPDEHFSFTLYEDVDGLFLDVDKK